VGWIQKSCEIAGTAASNPIMAPMAVLRTGEPFKLGGILIYVRSTSRCARTNLLIRNPKKALTLLTLAALTVAAPAAAHEADSLSVGLAGGFLHPLSGPDHLLAMIAVGLWGAFLGRPLIYLLPVVFPAVMAVGGVLGMAGVPFPPVEIGIAFSVLILGTAILAGWRAPVWAATLIVGIFGLFHGYAHGLELPSMADPISFSFGFVITTGLLHLVGIALGTLQGRPRGELALRLVGGMIAAAGVWFMLAALSSGATA
jgi:urease accessory protein